MKSCLSHFLGRVTTLQAHHLILFWSSTPVSPGCQMLGAMTRMKLIQCCCRDALSLPDSHFPYCLQTSLGRCDFRFATTTPLLPHKKDWHLFITVTGHQDQAVIHFYPILIFLLLHLTTVSKRIKMRLDPRVRCRHITKGS